MLATGGFTDGVSIAGEEGMEAVISFDPAYRDQNIAIWQKAGQLLGALGSSSGENAGLTNTAGKLLALDDFSLGRGDAHEESRDGQDGQDDNDDRVDFAHCTDHRGKHPWQMLQAEPY